MVLEGIPYPMTILEESAYPEISIWKSNFDEYQKAFESHHI